MLTLAAVSCLLTVTNYPTFNEAFTWDWVKLGNVNVVNNPQETSDNQSTLTMRLNHLKLTPVNDVCISNSLAIANLYVI